jgi:hypothetical protein
MRSLAGVSGIDMIEEWFPLSVKESISSITSSICQRIPNRSFSESNIMQQYLQEFSRVWCAIT